MTGSGSKQVILHLRICRIHQDYVHDALIGQLHDLSMHGAPAKSGFQFDVGSRMLGNKSYQFVAPIVVGVADVQVTKIDRQRISFVSRGIKGLLLEAPNRYQTAFQSLRILAPR